MGKLIHLNEYQCLKENDKIETEHFLATTREVVDLIDTFGKIFKPVVMDMRGNVNKLTQTYSKDKVQHKFVEDMISLEVEKGETIIATDALLWLKRSLEFMLKFFELLLGDFECKENLKDHMKTAYDETLKPFHNVIAQKTVSMLFRFIPCRSDLIGADEIQKQNVKFLEGYLKNFKSNVGQLQNFYKTHRFEDKIK